MGIYTYLYIARRPCAAISMAIGQAACSLREGARFFPVNYLLN